MFFCVGLCQLCGLLASGKRVGSAKQEGRELLKERQRNKRRNTLHFGIKQKCNVWVQMPSLHFCLIQHSLKKKRHRRGMITFVRLSACKTLWQRSSPPRTNSSRNSRHALVTSTAASCSWEEGVSTICAKQEFLWSVNCITSTECS